MATIVTKIIDPDNGSGTDYTSLSAWEAGQQGDLTGVRDEIAVAKCRCTGGTDDTDQCVLDGWTTDPTHYIKVWTDPAETYRHSGKWETGNKYRLAPTIDEARSIECSESYCQFIGLMIAVTSNVARTDYTVSIYANGGAQIKVLGCVLKGKSGNTRQNGFLATSGAIGPLYVINNIIYDFTGTGSYGISLDNETTDQTGYAYNNTIVNCTTGLYTGRANTHSAKNNLVSGCTTAFSGGWNVAANNATNLADSTIGATTESGTRESCTFSFVGAADFHLQSTDTGAKGYGLNLYNDAAYPFQTDIDGQDRGGSGAQWDIGADEYAAAAVGSLLPWMLKRNRNIQHLLVR